MTIEDCCGIGGRSTEEDALTRKRLERLLVEWLPFLNKYRNLLLADQEEIRARFQLFEGAPAPKHCQRNRKIPARRTGVTRTLEP